MVVVPFFSAALVALSCCFNALERVFGGRRRYLLAATGWLLCGLSGGGLGSAVLIYWINLLG